MNSLKPIAPILSILVWIGGIPMQNAHSQANRALIVVGPSNHAPGTHEVAAGARLIKHCLETMENHKAIPSDVVHAWTFKEADLEAYSTVVLIGDQFPGERMAESEKMMRDLTRMMGRGCGLVCIHYGVGLGNRDMGPDGDHPLLHWMGGYFATNCDHHKSFARIYPAAEIRAADPNHPIASGWEAFTLKDEPYINNYFGPDDNHFLPGAFAVAVSMLPPEAPKKEIVAWGVERADSGRGFGVTLPHFYRNWEVGPLRKFILNGIVWTAKGEVPPGGIDTTLPNLRVFEPESIEPKPRSQNN